MHEFIHSVHTHTHTDTMRIRKFLMPESMSANNTRVFNQKIHFLIQIFFLMKNFKVNR